MLDSQITKKIEEFVYAKPRSVQEIAQHIGKNWRTIDRYIQEIKENFGTIETRTFRGGTRGALKIVYWASVEKASSSVFQEIIEKDIFAGKVAGDLSAFEIFQHIDDKKKKASVEIAESEGETNIGELINYLKKTEKQLFTFSGNLSLINLPGVFNELENLVKKGIPIKVVCRVDMPGRENIEKLLSLNFKYGKELVEIRHREQPLRAIMSDGRSFRIKELKEPIRKKNELSEKTFIFYTVNDKEWTEWLSKIFWKMFNSSINANRRLQEINKLIS